MSLPVCQGECHYYHSGNFRRRRRRGSYVVVAASARSLACSLPQLATAKEGRDTEIFALRSEGKNLRFCLYFFGRDYVADQALGCIIIHRAAEGYYTTLITT